MDFVRTVILGCAFPRKRRRKRQRIADVQNLPHPLRRRLVRHHRLVLEVERGDLQLKPPLDPRPAPHDHAVLRPTEAVVHVALEILHQAPEAQQRLRRALHLRPRVEDLKARRARAERVAHAHLPPLGGERLPPRALLRVVGGAPGLVLRAVDAPRQEPPHRREPRPGVLQKQARQRERRMERAHPPQPTPRLLQRDAAALGERREPLRGLAQVAERPEALPRAAAPRRLPPLALRVDRPLDGPVPTDPLPELPLRRLLRRRKGGFSRHRRFAAHSGARAVFPRNLGFSLHFPPLLLSSHAAHGTFARRPPALPQSRETFGNRNGAKDTTSPAGSQDYGADEILKSTGGI